METRSLKYWQIKMFALCWVAYALVYFGRVNISMALLDLQVFFQTDKAAVGMLGSVFFYTYAIGQLINGAISDKVSSRVFIFIGLFITGSTNVLFSLSTHYGLSLILWGLNGIGQSMLWASIVKTAGLWFKPRQYTKVIVGLNTSMVLGYVMAWGGSGLLLRFFPWRNIFLVPGITVLGFALVWLLLARNSPEDVGLALTQHKDNKQPTLKKDDEGATMPIKELLFATGLMFIVIGCVAQGMIKEGLGIWSPTILAQMYHVDISHVSVYILLIPIMNLLGILFAGVLNTWCKQRGKVTVIILIGMASIVFMLLLLTAKYSLVIGILGIGLASGLMYGANTILLGVIPIKYSKYGRAAFVTGFLDFCSYVGAGLSSTLVGRLMDRSSGVTSVFIIWIVIIWIVISLIAIGSIILSNINRFKKAV